MSDAKKHWQAAHEAGRHNRLSNCGLEDYKRDYRFPDNIHNMMEIGVGTGRAAWEMTEAQGDLPDDLYSGALTLVDLVEHPLNAFEGPAHKYLQDDMWEIPRNSQDFIICNLVFLHCEDDMVRDIIESSCTALKGDGLFTFNIAVSGKPHSKPHDIVRDPGRCSELIRGVSRTWGCKAAVVNEVYYPKHQLSYQWWEVTSE